MTNAFLAGVLGVTGMRVFVPAFGSITRVRATDGRFTLVSANESGHLRGTTGAQLDGTPASAGSG